MILHLALVCQEHWLRMKGASDLVVKVLAQHMGYLSSSPSSMQFIKILPKYPKAKGRHLSTLLFTAGNVWEAALN